MRKTARGTTSALLFFIGSLCACATAPVIRSDVAPPKVRLGPVIEVAKVRTGRDLARVLVDGAGRGHVVVASMVAKDVRHLVVGPEGLEETEVIREGVSLKSLDAARDPSGGLHVLLDGEHLAESGEGLWRSGRTPWKEGGYRAGAARFVPGGSDLIWAFTVKDREVGATGRWDWYFVGGPTGGCILPWYTHSEKLLVVPESGSPHASWTVVDVGDTRDVARASLGRDARGDVHVVYSSERTLIDPSVEARYASFNLYEGAPEREGKDGRRLRSVSGQRVELGGTPLAMSVEPGSGTTLLVGAAASRLLRVAAWSGPIPLPLTPVVQARLAPARRERFHAALLGQRDLEGGRGFPLYYAAFSGGDWSAPMEVGIANVSTVWEGVSVYQNAWEAVQIGSDGASRALLIWPTDGALLGRWIEFTDEGTEQQVSPPSPGKEHP